MGLDRVFNTPTINVDQEKYDRLIVIEERYKQLIKQEKKENLDFGQAIQYLKQGKKLQRKGWNGKNQYIELATGISYRNNDNDIIDVFHNDIESKAIAFVGTSGIQMGWLASQADMLAEDWRLVE